MTNASAAVAPLYSPFPPEAYSRPCGKGHAGIGYELRALEARPLWNLFWLSEPKLDEFLEGGPRSLIDMRVLTACRRALEQDLAGRAVKAWMVGHPMLFAGALKRPRAAKQLVPYKIFGAQWVETVMSRAQECRGRIFTDGVIEYANFGGRPYDVTLAGNSAKIMTLAFKKN